MNKHAGNSILPGQVPVKGNCYPVSHARQHFFQKIFGFIFLILFSLGIAAQTPGYFLSGDFSAPNTWTQASAAAMSVITSPTSSTYLYNTTAKNPTGITKPKGFRFYSATTAGTIYGPSGSDIAVNWGSITNLSTSGNATDVYTVAPLNNTNRVIFKTDAAARLLAYEIQGALASISGVARNPSGTVNTGQNVIVTATLSAALPTGQYVYLRYAVSGNFASSVILPMTFVSGTNYQATIPAAVNTNGAIIGYYVFTSGATSAPTNSDADLATINLSTSASYTVGASITWTTAAAGNWSSPSTWTANAVPPTSGSLGTVTINHKVTLDQNATASALDINADTLTTQGASTLTVTGTTTIASGAGLQNSGNIATYFSTNSLVLNNGGTYIHNAVGSSANGANTDFPGTSRTFGASSNVIIKKWANGGTSPTPLPASGNPGWGNLTIDVSNLAGNWVQAGNLTRIQGDFTVNATGTYYFGLLNNTSGTLNIGGNTNLSGGSFLILSNGSGKAAYITMNGNLTLTNSGKFQITTGGFNIFSTSEIYIYLKGDMTISNTAQILQPTTLGLVTVIAFCKTSGTQYFTSHATGISNPYIGWGVGDITKAGGCTNTLVLNSDFLANNTAVFRIYNNATLKCSGETYVSGVGAAFTLDGDPGGFTLFSGGKIEIGSKDGITTAGNSVGNIRSSGARNFNTAGHYTYNGTYNQVTGNGLPATISGSLTIDNSGALNDNFVTLTAAVNISQTVTFSQGVLNTGTTNLLTVSNVNTSAVVGGSIASFVNGPMKRYTSTVTSGNYVFPLGYGGSPYRYKPITLTTVNNIASGSDFTGQYFYSNPPVIGSDIFLSNLNGIVAPEYWQLNRNNGTSTGKITIPYTDPGAGMWRDATGASTSPCAGCFVGVIKRSTSTGIGNWDFTAATGSLSFSGAPPQLRLYTNNGDLISAEVTSFSPFTAGFYFSLVLPVKLVSFSGKLTGADAVLQWEIANQSELQFMELQYSLDGSSFKTMEKFATIGTGQFQFTDPQLATGSHFYRLMLVDKSGQQTYSQVILLTIGRNQTRIIGLQQNPVKAKLVVQVVSSRAQFINAVITDVLGRNLSSSRFSLNGGLNQLYIPSNRLTRGTYFIAVRTDDGIATTLKFVKE